mgnify:FL=1
MMLEKTPDFSLTVKPFNVRQPTEKEFDLFSKLVLKELGLVWGKEKKYLLHARVQKRLQYHKLHTFQNYYDLIQSEKNGSELQYFYNAVTTTKSGFYREKQHFDFIRREILPQLKERRGRQRLKLRFWSAGCASGEEAFSLAMETHDFLGAKLISDGGLRILASDVNTEVLDSAIKGNYTSEQISPIPAEFRNRYFVSGSDKQNDVHSIRTGIRKFIQFRHFNLIASEYPIATKFQLIFCRNVLYYLHPERRELLLNKLVDHLDEQGWLVLGITESGYRIDGLKKHSYCIYRKI